MARTKTEQPPLSWDIENAVYSEGFCAVCGCDEAGRGPLAGPVVAAAVILPRDLCIPGLNDSKKLSPKKRDALYDVICEKALAYAIAKATVEEIDTLNILNASMLAMRRAVDALSAEGAGAGDALPDCILAVGGTQRNGTDYAGADYAGADYAGADFALIDGNVSRGFSIPTQTVIGGDAKSPSIAAASILAKVTRDRMCLVLDAAYPVYGFAKHKGYSTREHMDNVRKYGPCPEHRRTFLKFLYEDGE